MDNRDKGVVCPLYRSGAKNTTTNRREIGRRRRSIIFANGGIRITIEFETVDARIAFNKRNCKCGYVNCPYFRLLGNDDKTL